MGILDTINKRLANVRKPSTISDVTFRARRGEDAIDDPSIDLGVSGDFEPGKFSFPGISLSIQTEQNEQVEDSNERSEAEEDTVEEALSEEDVVDDITDNPETWEFGTDLDLGLDIPVDIENPFKDFELPEGFDSDGVNLNYGGESFGVDKMIEDFGLDIDNIGDFDFDQITSLFDTDDWEFGVDEELPGLGNMLPEIPGLSDLIGDINLGDFGGS